MVNRKLNELLGYSRTELIGRSVRALRGRGLGREAFIAFTRALAREKSEDFLLPLRAADDHDLLARIRIVQIPARRDLVSLWIQSGNSTDARHDLVSTILAALPRLQSLSDDHFYVMEITDDLHFKMLWLDGRAEANLGYSIKDLEELDGLTGIVVEDDRALLREHHQRLIAGESLETSYRVRLPNRSIRRVLDRAQALKSSHSALAFHVVGSLRPTHDLREGITSNSNLIRLGAALAGQLHALVCLVSERGDIVWASNEPATPLADSIRRAMGRDVTRYVSGRHLDDWLNLVDQAFVEIAPVNGGLHWPLDNEAIPLFVHAARVDEEFALLVVRPSEDVINGRPSAAGLRGKASNEFLAIELLSQPAFTISGSGIIAEINKAALQLSHRNFGDRLATGAGLQTLVDTSFAPSVTQALLRANQTGEIVTIEAGLGDPYQSIFIKFHFQLIHDPSSTRPSKLLAVMDIVDQVEPSPLEASRLEAHLSAVLDLANDGLLLVDEFGRVLRADAKANSMFGRETGSLEGCELDDLLKRVDGTNGALEALVDRLSADPSRSEIMLAGACSDRGPGAISRLSGRAGLRAGAARRAASERKRRGIALLCFLRCPNRTSQSSSFS
ncbi:PAS domain-containing protein [Arboricoccus pini]|uniref:PAS domain-containing protein n=2 Tax=Arboricoccus pini TaxID=1963835 RepID=A0A212R039_9PROT|nr:PAS domain-containing protein [Arboricoccus pini]